MGLASALSTALTGLNAAETQIDVVGNNLANSQTVGFKKSKAIFATQFFQTLSLGASPTEQSGGTNPRQTGLGTQVAAINPDFTQGTIEISSNPSDLAIQGDGFFVVESAEGENLYTRNGVFQINSENQLVTVNGNRLLGFGVDEFFDLETTVLQPLDVPIGSTSIAQPTRNVFFEGTLTPTGDVADAAQVIETATLSDGNVPRPDSSAVNLGVASAPSITATTATSQTTGGSLTPGDTYQYRFAFVDNSGTESVASDPVTSTVAAGADTIRLDSLPTDSVYTQLNIYRTAAGGSAFSLLDTVPIGTATYDDNGSAATTSALDASNISGNYSYLITFFRAGQPESRPSLLLGPNNVSDGRIQISNLPTPPVSGPGSGFPAYDQIRVYRNLASDASNFYLVSTLDPSESFTDNRSDADISDLTNPLNKQIDFDGPRVTSNTLLTNVLTRDGLDFDQPFQEGTLSFTGRKGGRSLSAKEFIIGPTSTVQELIDFMEESMGIREAADDPQFPIPNSVNNIPGESTALSPGGVIQNGRIRFVSNNGIDNAVDVTLSSFDLTDTNGQSSAPNLSFGTIQDAVGQSAFANVPVYDSLGIPLELRVTTVLESRTGTATTYRWFADSPENDPSTGTEIGVGTGLITFDGEGNIVSISNGTVSIDRRTVPSASPLEFELDFSQVSGLAVDQSSLAASRQDGSEAGSLSSFRISENGIITGSFSNGITRTLGQIRLARFANPGGLEQKGENLYGVGANSGLAIEGDPGQNGVGSLVSGAVELSNSDVGKDLVNLVLATTQYRGSTRVITASQQLLDELLNLRR